VRQQVRSRAKSKTRPDLCKRTIGKGRGGPGDRKQNLSTLRIGAFKISVLKISVLKVCVLKVSLLKRREKPGHLRGCIYTTVESP
jgi:hypothetical protein